jgi:hypothetical protein
VSRNGTLPIDIDHIFIPYRPCYESLTNNVSTPLLETKLNTWPEGTAPFVRHFVLRDYIQDTAKKAGVDNVTKYGAQVTKVYKEGSTWTVKWSTLKENDEDIVENEDSAVRYQSWIFCPFISFTNSTTDV